MRALAVVFAMTCLVAPAAGQDFFTLKGHGGPVMGIAVAPDTGQIATASFDNSVGLWSGRDPRWLERHDAAVKAVRFVDAGRLLSAGDDFALIDWRLGTGEPEVLGHHKGKIMSIAVSPDRTLAATASWDGTIGLWPLDGGAPRFLSGHDQGVNDVVFSPDGARLWSASADGTIRIWDVARGEETQLLLRHGFGVNRLAMGPGGAWLAYGAVDGGTRAIDPETGRALADLTLDRRPILALAPSPDGALLAVGDGEGYIMVVETDGWRIARDFRATARGPVWALAFSPDGQSVHAAGIDDVMYSWPVDTMDEHGQMATAPRTFLQKPATMSNGERQFQRKCSICHSLTGDGGRKAGPTLAGLFGRPAGTVAGYPYSPILATADFTWSEQTVDALFDLGPDHFIPGSKMPMQRITGAEDRADLIAFLQQATATNGD
jgi:cytochrome c